MEDDCRVERELLRREFHRNEMETSIRYLVNGGGVTLAVADTRESAESIKQKLEECTILTLTIEHEYY